jgi:Tfp pilus assembly pilus retraction ATPase PilT
MRTAVKAETGHTSRAPLLTNAIQTVERIIGTFGRSTRWCASAPTTCRRRSRRFWLAGRGRGAAALEILIATKTISKLISDNRLRDIYGVMQSARKAW